MSMCHKNETQLALSDGARGAHIFDLEDLLAATILMSRRSRAGSQRVWHSTTT